MSSSKGRVGNEVPYPVRGAEGEVPGDLCRDSRGGFWAIPGVRADVNSHLGSQVEKRRRGQFEPQESRKHAGHSKSTVLALK